VGPYSDVTAMSKAKTELETPIFIPSREYAGNRPPDVKELIASPPMNTDEHG